jgi:hypothetical protein
MDRPTLDVADRHAHLLIAETGGLVVVESPEEVMAEVEFRATHLSSLMEDMFKEAMNREWWGDDET